LAPGASGSRGPFFVGEHEKDTPTTSPSFHGFTSATNAILVENPPRKVRVPVRPTSKMQKVLFSRAARNRDFLAGFARHLEVGPFFF
jgi:hypothetical protein